VNQGIRNNQVTKEVADFIKREISKIMKTEIIMMASSSVNRQEAAEITINEGEETTKEVATSNEETIITTMIITKDMEAKGRTTRIEMVVAMETTELKMRADTTKRKTTKAGITITGIIIATTIEETARTIEGTTRTIEEAGTIEETIIATVVGAADIITRGEIITRAQ
jgi:hypothetical protein